VVWQAVRFVGWIELTNDITNNTGLKAALDISWAEYCGRRGWGLTEGQLEM